MSPQWNRNGPRAQKPQKIYNFLFGTALLDHRPDHVHFALTAVNSTGTSRRITSPETEDGGAGKGLARAAIASAALSSEAMPWLRASSAASKRPLRSMINRRSKLSDRPALSAAEGYLLCRSRPDTTDNSHSAVSADCAALTAGSFARAGPAGAVASIGLFPGSASTGTDDNAAIVVFDSSSLDGEVSGCAMKVPPDELRNGRSRPLPETTSGTLRFAVK